MTHLILPAPVNARLARYPGAFPADRRCAGAARPARRLEADFESADAFVWHAAGRRLSPVPKVNRVEMSLLRGIDRVRDILSENTTRFARGLPANNALLWGARGMGKSSLVKAVHAEINHLRDACIPAPQADRDPPRGHRNPAGPDGTAQRRPAPLHHLLRRSLVRFGRHLLQVPEGRARRAASRGVPRT